MVLNLPCYTKINFTMQQFLKIRELLLLLVTINNLFYVGKKKNMYIANKLINANKIV